MASRLNKAWTGLSARERRLAGLVAILILAMAAFTGFKSIRARLHALDGRIAGQEDALVNYTYLIAAREQIETEYARIAVQHSSAWQEAEIHDRLRQEVMRLAEKSPPGLTPEGIPEQVTGGEGQLVRIPKLTEGQLLEGEEGYRQYALHFRVPQANFLDLAAFLGRLQESPQSLRIDRLSVSRNWDSPLCSADISIIRTIADADPNDVAAYVEKQAEPVESPDESGAMLLNEWSCDGASLEESNRFAGPGQTSILVQAQEANAQAYTQKNLLAGTVYEFSLDLIPFGECRLGVRGADGTQAFDGERTILEKDGPTRYQVRFTVPAGGARTMVRIPCIVLSEPESKVYLANFSLRKVEGF